MWFKSPYHRCFVDVVGRVDTDYDIVAGVVAIAAVVVVP